MLIFKVDCMDVNIQSYRLKSGFTFFVVAVFVSDTSRRQLLLARNIDDSSTLKTKAYKSAYREHDLSKMICNNSRCLVEFQKLTFSQTVFQSSS